MRAIIIYHHFEVSIRELSQISSRRQTFRVELSLNASQTAPTGNFESSKPHSKQRFIGHGTITGSSSLHSTCRAGCRAGCRADNNWTAICQRFKDIEDSFPTADCALVPSAGRTAISLIVRPLTAHETAAPTLIALLYTCKSVCSAIAGILALWNRH
jgi:hypothetical protein